MKNINELNKLLHIEKDVDEYWKNKQKTTTRGYRIISPPLNSLVYEVCYKLLIKQHIIWLGGPPGVGKTSCAKRFQDYGFMAMDCEDSWNSTKDRRLSVSEKISKKVYKRFSMRFQNYGFLEKDGRYTGLKKISEKVYKELNTSFVFGACYGNFC